MKRCFEWILNSFIQWVSKMEVEEKIGFAIGGIIGIAVGIAVLFVSIDGMLWIWALASSVVVGLFVYLWVSIIISIIVIPWIETLCKLIYRKFKSIM